MSDLRDQLRRAGFRITAEDARTLADELEQAHLPVVLADVGDAQLIEDAEWVEAQARLFLGIDIRASRLRRAAQCIRVYVAERIAQREGGTG
jgi:hypothetical protein